MMTGSMTAAARWVHTSQPHVSRLIAQLEAITQFPLFDRNGSRLTPTQDGSRFFQEVEKPSSDWPAWSPPPPASARSAPAA